MTMMFNAKNWSVQQEIQKRVQRESEVEWGKQPTASVLPKYEKPAVEKEKVGWYIFFKIMLNELRP